MMIGKGGIGERFRQRVEKELFPGLHAPRRVESATPAEGVEKRGDLHPLGEAEQHLGGLEDRVERSSRERLVSVNIEGGNVDDGLEIGFHEAGPDDLAQLGAVLLLFSVRRPRR